MKRMKTDKEIKTIALDNANEVVGSSFGYGNKYLVPEKIEVNPTFTSLSIDKGSIVFNLPTGYNYLPEGYFYITANIKNGEGCYGSICNIGVQISSFRIARSYGETTGDDPLIDDDVSISEWEELNPQDPEAQSEIGIGITGDHIAVTDVTGVLYITKVPLAPNYEI